MATAGVNVLEPVLSETPLNGTTTPFDVYSVDLNGDGQPDLVFKDDGSGSGDYELQTVVATPTGFAFQQDLGGQFSLDRPTVGTTADGTVDIVLFDPEGPSANAYTVYQDPGTGTFTRLPFDAPLPVLTTTYSPIALGMGRATDDTVTFNADGTITVGPPPGSTAYPSQTYAFPVTYPYTGTTAANLEYVISSGQSFALVFGNYTASQRAAQQQGAAPPPVNEVLAGALETPCYAEGTRILTTRGEVAVEALREGDLAVALLGGGGGGPGLAAVRWLGHRALDLRAHPDPRAVRPVRIRAGALGEGRPHRDLVVSPGHALLLDGVLVQAARLVNGHSIVQEAPERVTYWHVELERHDVLLAEGVAAESFLDTGNRGAFSNGGVPVELHPDFRARRMAATCAPLVEAGERLERIKARLLARARDGFGARDTGDPALHLLVDGTPLAPQAVEQGVHRFHVPPGSRTLRLCSRRWVPAELLAASTDTRELGVCVRGLRLDAADLALDDPSLDVGWQSAERDAGGALRWTGGAAALPPGVRTVEVTLGGFATYWAEPAPVEPAAEDRIAGRR